METRYCYYAEVLGGGRAILRRDLLDAGRVVLSEAFGSPAPLATVEAAAKRMNGGA